MMDLPHQDKINIRIQFWLTENLNVSKYGNGDDIPEVKDKKEWKKLTTGACQYCKNNAVPKYKTK